MCCEADAFLEAIGKKETSSETWTIMLLLNGQHTVEFQIDTGADVTVIPESLFTTMQRLTPSSRKLCGPALLLQLWTHSAPVCALLSLPWIDRLPQSVPSCHIYGRLNLWPNIAGIHRVELSHILNSISVQGGLSLLWYEVPGSPLVA